MIAPAGRRGYEQTAYQIVVKNSSGKAVWDTGKIEDGDSLGITYAGDPIQAATRYDWTVTVWDNHKDHVSQSSWFETGLMNPAMSAWDSAAWIGGGDDDLVFYSKYLSVFSLQYTIQLDKPSDSTRAGFILGANDYRLLDKNMNFFNIESKKDETYIKLELDISNVDGSETGLAKLNIYRVGYAPDDSPDTPFQSYDIADTFINQDNKYDKHHFKLGCVFGQISITMDGSSSFVSNKGASRGGTRRGFGGRRGGAGVSTNLNPVGSGGDYISFPMLTDIGFSVSPGQKAYFSDVAVMHYRSPSNKIFQEDLTTSQYNGIYADSRGLSVQNGAYTLTGGPNGVFIAADPSRNAMPMLRAEFAAKKASIEKARLYVTSRGVYEIYINGTRIGDDYFNPGLTQYNITHMYQTYDVTDMLKVGQDNAIGALLGQGWWSGNYTFTGNNWNYFGDRQSLLAKLVITCSDGTTQILTTNDKDWKYYNDGPIRYGSFFQGEVYDADKEKNIEDWSTVAYDDRNWTNATEVPLEGTAFVGSQSGSGFGGRGGRGGFGGRMGTGRSGEAAATNNGSPQSVDTQTSYAVGLALSVFSEDRASDFARRLADAVERLNVDDSGVTRPEYSLMTGFIGTAWISKALSDYGYCELAYKLLQNDHYPSWLYAVDQGATTIWERLNGYTIENGFGGNNSMNSFNHYSFGAVGQWMIAYSLGIQRDEPGFRKFILQPETDPTGQMTWAEGHYDSVYGRINSVWKVNDKILTYTATIPANTTATLYLPAASKDNVTEGEKPALDAEGVKFIKYESGKAVYELHSGSYEFRSLI